MRPMINRVTPSPTRLSASTATVPADPPKPVSQASRCAAPSSVCYVPSTPLVPPWPCLRAGHLHNFEKNLLRCDWSPDGARVAINQIDDIAKFNCRARYAIGRCGLPVS